MATETSTHSDTQTGIELDAQIVVALTFGAVLGLVGVLGPALGGANGELLVFGRNYLHDAVHLGSGVLGLIAGYAAGGTHARTYNRTLGAVYLLVAALGSWSATCWPSCWRSTWPTTSSISAWRSPSWASGSPWATTGEPIAAPIPRWRSAPSPLPPVPRFTCPPVPHTFRTPPSDGPERWRGFCGT